MVGLWIRLDVPERVANTSRWRIADDVNDAFFGAWTSRLKFITSVSIFKFLSSKGHKGIAAQKILKN